VITLEEMMQGEWEPPASGFSEPSVATAIPAIFATFDHSLNERKPRIAGIAKIAVATHHQKIPKLHHPCDLEWMESMLMAVPWHQRPTLSEEYSTRYQQALDAEPIEHKKEGRARYMANSWLREQIHPTELQAPPEPAAAAATPPPTRRTVTPVAMVAINQERKAFHLELKDGTRMVVLTDGGRDELMEHCKARGWEVASCSS
jgi:hypothetical protein